MEIHLPRWNELPDIDLYMDQVITLLNKYIEPFSSEGEITPSMINNYVKHGVIPAPVKKRYSRVHISRLLIVCVLKPVLSIQRIGEITESLLKDRSEEELLNFFSEQYERTLEHIEGIVLEGSGELRGFYAAAAAGGFKMIAESELRKEPQKSEQN
ncbi:MAG: DUF1836 domain-containing protein [Oscillospiraceae bacterium]|nr:DUF1836 domain-containing protein [Oscillospiraceae bacterium]